MSGFLAWLVRFLRSTPNAPTTPNMPDRTSPDGRTSTRRPRPTHPSSTTHTSTRPSSTTHTSTRAASTRPGAGSSTVPAAGRSYAGDFTGKATLAYTPVDDNQPDPGEVVWAWVPFEEDHSQGKDRPVLVIARNRGHLLGLMLTSKDHDRDAQQEARHGRLWMDVGTGDWDSRGRPSEVRLDRILQLSPDAVRREGATLGRPVYDQVASAVRAAKGW